MKFLDDPQSVVPGTTMPDPGLKDEKTREEMVKLLEDLRVGE